MTTDFRALCAELLSELENAIGVIYGEDGTRHISSADAVITKADAALAEPEPERPTDIEIASILKAYAVVEPQMGASRILHEKHFSDAVRAVRARWERPAPQLADGEVAELVAWLRGANWDRQRQTLATRAASLLERLSPPQPVPVSERPPGPEDCDAGGRCWWWNPATYASGPAWWSYEPVDWAEDATHWLPAHALPVLITP